MLQSIAGRLREIIQNDLHHVVLQFEKSKFMDGNSFNDIQIIQSPFIEFSLQETNNHDAHDSESSCFYELIPKWKNREDTMYHSYHNELDKFNQGGETLSQIWADCFRVCSLVLGSDMDIMNCCSKQNLHRFKRVSKRSEHASSSSHTLVEPGYTLQELFPQTHLFEPLNIGQVLCYFYLKQSIMESCRMMQQHESELSSKKVIVTPSFSTNSSSKKSNDFQNNSNLDLGECIRNFNLKNLKPQHTIVRGTLNGGGMGCIDDIQMTRRVNHNSTFNSMTPQWLQFKELWDRYGKWYLKNDKICDTMNTTSSSSSSSCKNFHSNTTSSSSSNHLHMEHSTMNFHIDECTSTAAPVVLPPDVGDILLTIPCVHCSQWTRFIEASYNPNFHFAIVILVERVSGLYITLENWAVNDVHAVNGEWGLCCYRSTMNTSSSSSSTRSSSKLHTSTCKNDPQRMDKIMITNNSSNMNSMKSYHETLTSKGGYGNIAMTITLKLQ
ncbi:hypothetical protein C9374_000871 [Naegleria lovaniensis]|uniref:Uncharacterized protein n=1 Tax=Naegleria lovaniensis TaxID=51637 RepID=A0AA88GTC1_NAELO|nr:uncharacterized protein C9374_000871 [Naegleria lovaniensis]KAG2388021.1 hypothetical protein C9374_000871 [Naegleria lovaniensis]